MSTVKFFCESTDSPRESGIVSLTLPVPSPGLCEYRRYFNHRNEDQEQEEGTVSVPVADFVAVIADHEPSEAEWEAVLQKEGYLGEQITNMLGNA